MVQKKVSVHVNISDRTALLSTLRGGKETISWRCVMHLLDDLEMVHNLMGLVCAYL